MSFIARLFCFSHDYVRAGDYLVCRDCGDKVKVKSNNSNDLFRWSSTTIKPDDR